MASGSPSQDKSIDDLKREKQQLKDDLSEKVMSLSLIVSDLNCKLKDYENERLSLVTAKSLDKTLKPNGKQRRGIHKMQQAQADRRYVV